MLEQALFDPVSEAQPWRIDPVTSRISHVSFLVSEVKREAAKTFGVMEHVWN